MIVPMANIAEICQNLRQEGKTIVFTNGCFDLIHLGHVDYLRRAKQLGDVLIVGLNSDDSVKRLKGPNRPIVPQNDRAEILDSLKPVDFVVIFDQDTPYELIKLVQPNILVKGGDYNPDEIVGADLVTSYGGKVVTVPFVPNRSTTNIVKKILEA